VWFFGHEGGGFWHHGATHNAASVAQLMRGIGGTERD
jgi:hypothetical protein